MHEINFHVERRLGRVVSYLARCGCGGPEAMTSRSAISLYMGGREKERKRERARARLDGIVYLAKNRKGACVTGGGEEVENASVGSWLLPARSLSISNLRTDLPFEITAERLEKYDQDQDQELVPDEVQTESADTSSGKKRNIQDACSEAILCV